jgi:SAM-dependent methyltransferase
MLGKSLQSREAIQERLDELKLKYGDWAYDIPLPHGIWTGGNLQNPHTRLKRILQIANDLCNKPLSACRVLDLGCLDGIFSIEFALHGAATIGIEIREAHIQKAQFCKEVLGLDNLEFHQDDVRNISLEAYGTFDVILCSGILYHLPALDAINLIEKMYKMASRVVMIDTHVSLFPEEEIRLEKDRYWGDSYREHSDGASDEEKVKRLWASVDNETSFWFTKPSLVNLLSKTGFSSVYECFMPLSLIPRMDFQYAGIRAHERCTIVAIRDHEFQLKTSPAANNLWQEWPETGLSSAPAITTSKPETQGQLEELTRKHNEMIHSKAWKFVLMLRKMRVSFVPPGSTRETLARFFLKPLIRYMQKEDERQ